jgi:ferredoxin
MPTIEILANDLGPAVVVDAEGPLVDICDDARAPIDFSCRSASCGTCLVEVLTGADLLAPPAPDEREVLHIFDAPPTHRLACQAIVQPGPGLVQLRRASD